MADIGKEFALGAVGGLRSFFGLFHLFFREPALRYIVCYAADNRLFQIFSTKRIPVFDESLVAAGGAYFHYTLGMTLPYHSFEIGAELSAKMRRKVIGKKKAHHILWPGSLQETGQGAVDTQNSTLKVVCSHQIRAALHEVTIAVFAFTQGFLGSLALDELSDCAGHGCEDLQGSLREGLAGECFYDSGQTAFNQ